MTEKTERTRCFPSEKVAKQFLATRKIISGAIVEFVPGCPQAAAERY